MRVKITTPVADHNGAVGNVTIIQGVGYADTETHAAEIAYCRRNGYTVAPVNGPEPEAEVDQETPEPETGEQTPEPQTPAAVTQPEPTAPSGPAEPPAAAPAGDGKTPARNASADTWRTYAIAHGMDPDDAAELSRDQLVERFTSKEDNK